MVVIAAVHCVCLSNSMFVFTQHFLRVQAGVWRVHAGLVSAVPRHPHWRGELSSHAHVSVRERGILCLVTSGLYPALLKQTESCPGLAVIWLRKWNSHAVRLIWPWICLWWFYRRRQNYSEIVKVWFKGALCYVVSAIIDRILYTVLFQLSSEIFQILILFKFEAVSVWLQ